MKASCWSTVRENNKGFISHMVQMKGAMGEEIDPRGCTLYPTWFRWKGRNPKDITTPEFLYIPHGSDESFTQQFALVVFHALYPTWFRWKCSNVSRHERASLPLYPTWFRWKVHCNASSNPSASFISHMVQMKENFINYITREHKFFISHMVQMKVYSFCYSVLNHLITLYPTWFRWKG